MCVKVIYRIGGNSSNKLYSTPLNVLLIKLLCYRGCTCCNMCACVFYLCFNVELTYIKVLTVPFDG